MKKFSLSRVFLLMTMLLFFNVSFAKDSLQVKPPDKTEITAKFDQQALLNKLDSLSKDSAARAEIKQNVLYLIADFYIMPVGKNSTFTNWLLWLLKVLTPIYFLIGVFVSNKPTEKPNKFWQLFQIIGRYFIAPPNRNKEGGTHE